jgi:hypothetical protein
MSDISGYSIVQFVELWRCSAPAEQKRQEPENQKHKEQNLCDSRRCPSDTAETQEGGNQGNDQKN